MKVMNINKKMRQSSTFYTVPRGKVAKVFLNCIRCSGVSDKTFFLYFEEYYFKFVGQVASGEPVMKDMPVASDTLIVCGSSGAFTAVPRLHYLTSGESLSCFVQNDAVMSVYATVFEESL